MQKKQFVSHHRHAMNVSFLNYDLSLTVTILYFPSADIVERNDFKNVVSKCKPGFHRIIQYQPSCLVIGFFITMKLNLLHIAQ